MRNKTIKSLATIALLTAGLKLSAQEITLHNMEFVGQRHSLNPALNPITRFYLGFNGGANLSNPLSLNDARRFDENSDSFYWSPIKVLEQLRRNNALRMEEFADVSFGFRVTPKLFVHGAVTQRIQVRFNYPRDLFAFLIEGNLHDNNVGKDLNIGGFRLNGTAYIDHSLGAAYQVNCNLTVGARAKFLRGFANVHTEKAHFNIRTNSEYYQITMNNDLDFRASLPDENEDFAPLDILKMKNTGMGLDLGATYTMLDKKLLLTASLIDLGYINWRENGKRYYNQSETKTFTFNGFNKETMEESGDAFGNIADTIMTTFDLGEENIARYRTGLTPKMYLSGSYELMKGNRVGGLVYAEIANRRLHTAWSVNGQMRLGRIVNLQGNISLMNKRISNIGLGFAANLGPIQLWAVTNNAIPLLRKNLTLYDIRVAHVRLGMNIVVAYGKDKKNPCSPDYVPPGERGKKNSKNSSKKQPAPNKAPAPETTPALPTTE